PLCSQGRGADSVAARVDHSAARDAVDLAIRARHGRDHGACRKIKALAQGGDPDRVRGEELEARADRPARRTLSADRRQLRGGQERAGGAVDVAPVVHEVEGAAGSRKVLTLEEDTAVIDPSDRAPGRLSDGQPALIEEGAPAGAEDRIIA